MRSLATLRLDGDPLEQDFVDYFVTSKLDSADAPDWDLAWRRAEDHWSRALSTFLASGCDHKEAQTRARNQLLRGAMARLNRLGF